MKKRYILGIVVVLAACAYWFGEPVYQPYLPIGEDAVVGE